MKTFVSRDKELQYAIDIAKKNFGATAWKLELESYLNRGDDCSECEGSPESDCYNCDGSGEVTARDSEDYEYEVSCARCDGTGVSTCSNCDGESSGWSIDDCQEFIDNYVSRECKEATIYGNCYYDPSVDTEYTVTVPIDHPEYLLEYINAFNALADEIGNGHDVSNAGMHIAVLNSEGGTYPRGNTLDLVKLENFRNSVTPLLPALLFLGTPNSRTRGIHFRVPRIDRDKYSMIHTENGIEYRFFDTCYDNPEAIFDNLIVIGRTLEYYTTEYTPVNLGVKATIRFEDEGKELNDVFSTVEHLKVLEAGLKFIRPTYKTYSQLKAQRDFKMTPQSARAKQLERIERLRKDYIDYKKRVQRNIKATTYRARAEYIEREIDRTTETPMTQYVRDFVRTRINQLSLREFTERELNNSHRGFTLTV